MRRSFWLPPLCGWILAAGVVVGRGDDASPVDPDRVTQLIEQLGDQDYFVRERAQAELAAFGFEAFDALSDAETHDDIEIASRAKYLLRRMRVEWSSDADPPKVRELLKDYERQNPDQRLNRMRSLAALPDDAGVPALCRLMRFEQSLVLSKYAAIAIIEQPTDDKTNRPQREKLIVDGIRRSPRPGAEWLKTYLATPADAAAALPEWERLVRVENETLSQYPDQTDVGLVMALLKQQAAGLVSLGRYDETLPLVQQMIDVAAGEADTLNNVAIYAYTQAEAHDKAGRSAVADKLAAAAHSVNPGNALEHLKVAYNIKNDGLFKWAEKEFRHVVELGPPGRDLALQSQWFLAEMLHDLERDQDAAQVLEASAAAMEENIKQGNAAQNRDRETTAIRARMHYFYACHHGAEGDVKKQAERLEAGIKEDPLDADVLIGLYRLPNRNAEQKQRTMQLIQEAVDAFRRQIEVDPDNPGNSEPYNQLAWLVGNTEGDQAEALAASLRSLELRPDTAGYLDTLGRCYFAQGDYENAVKSQEAAIELDPHSGQMNRQMEQFRAALANQRKRKSKSN